MELPSIAAVLKNTGFLAKKSLGQNFLVDSNISEKIVRAVAIEPQDCVVEVGPGIGSLTRPLLEANPRRLVVIEKDPRFLGTLRELQQFYPRSSLEIHIADAMDIDLPRLLGEETSFKVVSNLPYNVGTRLLVQWVEEECPVTRMVLMMQKEVVDRLKAKVSTSDYGRLTILVQRLYEVTALFSVPPQAFIPAPKVTSSVVALERLQEPRCTPPKALFKALTAHAFQQRRKMVKTSLKEMVPHVEQILEELKIPPGARPENMSLEQFGALAAHKSLIKA